MASESDSPNTESCDREAEIFDRLFELDEEDVDWIKKHIGEHMKACKSHMSMNPPQWEAALREAEEASIIALAEGLSDVESKINFYMARCYRGLGKWGEAYELYKMSTVDSEDIHWLQNMRTQSKERMDGEKNPELRRVKGLSNLHTAYGDEEKTEKRRV